MRRLTATSLFLILGCAIAVSFRHTMDLFEHYGFRGWLSLLATVMVELVFITASSILISAKLNGQKLRFSTICGFAYGVAMVGWSNVASTSKFGWDGVLIGLSIPLGVFLVEGMFMDAVFGHRLKMKSKAETTDHDRTTNQMDDSYRNSDQPDNHYRPDNQMVGYQNATDQIDDYYQDDYRPDSYHLNSYLTDYRNTTETDNHYHDSEKPDYHYHGINQLDDYQDNQQTDNHNHATEQPDSKGQDTDKPGEHEQATNHPTDHEQTTDRIDDHEQATERPTDQPDNHEQDTNYSNNRDQDTNQDQPTETTDRKDTANDRDDTREEIEKAKAVALRIQQETGKLPGRVRLEKEAGVKQWAARKALTDLKRTG